MAIIPVTGALLDRLGREAGVDPPEGTEGRSLLPLLRGEESDDSLAYAEVWFHDRLVLGRYLKQCLATGALLPEGYETFLY